MMLCIIFPCVRFTNADQLKPATDLKCQTCVKAGLMKQIINTTSPHAVSAPPLYHINCNLL